MAKLSSADIVAVADLASEVYKLGYQYIHGVSIEPENQWALYIEVEKLNKTLEETRGLFKGPERAKLENSRHLRDSLHAATLQLRELETGFRAEVRNWGFSRLFKQLALVSIWPHDKERAAALYKSVRHCRHAIFGAPYNEEIEQLIRKIPIAKDAAFEFNASVPGVQNSTNAGLAVRQEVLEWINEPGDKRVYWLTGEAGADLSSISRTVAQSLSDKGNLGGSFFFRQGESRRGNAESLFSTLAYQLATNEPVLARAIKGGLENFWDISRKNPGEQFRRLIFNALWDYDRDFLERDENNITKVVWVIDAFDQCEPDEDARIIFDLITRANKLKTIQLLVFLTSGPGLATPLVLNTTANQVTGTVLLREIPQSAVERDTAAFLHVKLAGIREQHNAARPSEKQLPPDWPGSRRLETLTAMVAPSLIAATTICRFMETPTIANPESQLAKVLECQKLFLLPGVDKAGAAYRLVLGQFGKGVYSHEPSLDEFRAIIGLIVTLFEPLPTSCLSQFLGNKESTVKQSLRPLYAVINVPESSEITVSVPQSFRALVFEDAEGDGNIFHVDEIANHKDIAIRCLELLSTGEFLKKNICNLEGPGTRRADIDALIVESHLPPFIRYACTHWVSHMERGQMRITDKHPACDFLKEHLLHWLESLSLLGKMSTCVTLFDTLQRLLEPDDSIEVSRILYDAKNLVFRVNTIADAYPLQVYESAVFFAPQESAIRQLYGNNLPDWMSIVSVDNVGWGSNLHILKGHSSRVTSVAFSPDSKTVASGSQDRTVRLWDALTGQERHVLQSEPYGGNVEAIEFSPDGSIVAAAQWDNTVRIWDTTTGREVFSLEGHTKMVTSISFSPDGKALVSASRDATIQLWDPYTGKKGRTITGHEDEVTVVCFSPNGEMIASGSRDDTVRLWTTRGGRVRTLEGHTSTVEVIAFSPDSKMIASGSLDNSIIVWSMESNKQLFTLKDHKGTISAVAFSPDGKTLGSASWDKTVRLWDAKSASLIHTFRDTRIVNSLAFSRCGNIVVSGTADGVARVWNVATGKPNCALHGHTDQIADLAISPDGSTLATASFDGTVRLWDPKHNEDERKLQEPGSGIVALESSPDGITVAAASFDGMIRLWDAESAKIRHLLSGHEVRIKKLIFSPDGKTLASLSEDGTIRLWDTDIGQEKATIPKIGFPYYTPIFSPDNTTFACVAPNMAVLALLDAKTGALRHIVRSSDPDIIFNILMFAPCSSKIASGLSNGQVLLWDVGTGKQIHALEGHTHSICAMEFSPDGTMLVSTSSEKMVRLWDLKTGQQKQLLNQSEGPLQQTSEVRAFTFSPDSSTLAAATWLDIRLWSTETGALIDRFPFRSTSAFKFSFAADGHSLITKKHGIIKRPSGDIAASPPPRIAEFLLELDQEGWGLEAKRDWIVRDGRRVVWIPPEFAAAQKVFQGHTLVLGDKSGDVKFIKFKV